MVIGVPDKRHHCSKIGHILSLLGWRQGGMTMIEAVITLAMLGIIGVAALSGLASLVISGGVVVDRASVVAIAQRQLEYVKVLPYQAAPSTYAVIDVPALYQVTCEAQSLPDGNMQKVVVAVTKGGRSLLVIEDIKVNR